MEGITEDLSKKENSTTYHSDKPVCKYGLCDGSGWIYNRATNSAAQCKCYKDQIQDNKLKFAKIPLEFSNLTINSFSIDLYEDKEKANLAKKMVARYVVNFEQFKEQGKGLYIQSKKKGSGKTRLAASLGNALIKQYGVRTRFITLPNLLNTIKDTFNDTSKYTEQQLIDEYIDIDILILDDFGVEKSTDWVTSVLFNILDSRMTHKKVTIFTSNVKVKDLKHDERIQSRVNKMTLQVEMPEEDIRSKLGEDENKELMKILLGEG